ncbi:MAG: hypothetical protein R3F59_30960 [Myxococcota bacterium]
MTARTTWVGDLAEPSLVSGVSGAVLGSIHPRAGDDGGRGLLALIAAGDLDGDGAGDLVTYDRSPYGLSEWPGPYEGEAAPVATLVLSDPVNVRPVDVTGDGVDELLIGHGVGAWVAEVPATGEVPLRDATLAHYTEDDILSGIGAGDLDGDGAVDVVLGDYSASTWVTDATGEVDLRAAAFAELTTTSPTVGLDFEVGDFDGDGQDDLAQAGSLSGTSGSDPARPLWVVAGPLQGVVDLDLVGTVRDIGAGNRYADSLTAGDLDGDGADELLVGGLVGSSWSNDRTETVWVLLAP